MFLILCITSLLNLKRLPRIKISQTHVRPSHLWLEINTPPRHSFVFIYIFLQYKIPFPLLRNILLNITKSKIKVTYIFANSL